MFLAKFDPNAISSSRIGRKNAGYEGGLEVQEHLIARKMRHPNYLYFRTW